MKLQDLNKTERTELIGFTIDRLKALQSSLTYGRELHSEIFNTDYYIIGRYEAEQWLLNGVGIFYAIEEIKEYEQDNFGEVNTDLSEAERVVNMFVYIVGELILQESETLSSNYDNILTEDDYTNIIEELEAV